MEYRLLNSPNYKVKNLCVFFSSLIMWKTDRSFNGQYKVLNKFKLIIKENHHNVFNGKIELERDLLKISSTTRDGLNFS